MAISSRAGFSPGSAWAEQSGFDVGTLPAFSSGGSLGDLLKRQLALRERMANLQAAALRQQIEQGRARFAMEKRVAAEARRGKSGLSKGLAGGTGQTSGGEFVRQFLAAHPGLYSMQSPTALMKLGDLMGVPMMHEGMMHTGSVLGQMAAAQQGAAGDIFRGAGAGTEMKEGGKAGETGFYKLHSGETVLPAEGRARKSYQTGTLPIGTPGYTGGIGAWMTPPSQWTPGMTNKYAWQGGDPARQAQLGQIDWSELPGVKSAATKQAAIENFMRTGLLPGQSAGGAGDGGTTEVGGTTEAGGAMPGWEQWVKQAQKMRGSLDQYNQQQATGFEKGGRVPSTGTYKLHKGEVVISKPVSDTLLGPAPQKSKGKPRKSYQFGTGMSPDVMNYLMQVYQRFARPNEMPTGLYGPAQPPVPTPPTPIRQDTYLPSTTMLSTGLTEGVGEAGERRFEQRGEPETEAERIKQWRDEVKRNEREAEYQRSRVNLLMSYFLSKPEALENPKVKALLGQRQFLAQQYQTLADKRQMQIEKIEQAEKQQETLKEIQKIESGGRTEVGRIQAQQKAQDVWQRQVMDLPGMVQTIQSDYAKNSNDDDYLRRMHTAFALYIPVIAQNLGQSIEATQAQVGGWIEESLDRPQNIELLIMLINNAVQGR